MVQDFIHLQSNGHKLTPKSLYFGLALRHLTGTPHMLNLGVTTRHDLANIRSLNLRECCDTDVQTLELR